MLNPHLQNQLQDYLGKSFDVPDKLMNFLKEVSKTYDQFQEVKV